MRYWTLQTRETCFESNITPLLTILELPRCQIKRFKIYVKKDNCLVQIPKIEIVFFFLSFFGLHPSPITVIIALHSLLSFCDKTMIYRKFQNLEFGKIAIYIDHFFTYLPCCYEIPRRQRIFLLHFYTAERRATKARLTPRSILGIVCRNSRVNVWH